MPSPLFPRRSQERLRPAKRKSQDRKVALLEALPDALEEYLPFKKSFLVINSAKDGYGKIAKQGTSCCRSSASRCGNPALVQAINKEIGNSDKELKMVPGGANLGVGYVPSRDL